MQVSGNNDYNICIGYSIQLVELLVTIMLYYRKAMCYVWYSLAAVAIGKEGPGPVRECLVGST